MEVEAALLPPDIRLNTSIHKYVFRALKLAPKLAPSHPIEQEPGSSLGLVGSEVFKTKATQLERIKNSILGLAVLDTLQPIQHFKYPPWDRDIAYTVEVNSLAKDKAAIAHVNSLASIVYTDASAIPDNDSTGIGIGLAIYSLGNSQRTAQSRSNIGPYQLVYNGELEAITQAVEYASQTTWPSQQCQIFSDNQAALYKLMTASDSPGQACQIRTSQATKLATEKGASVSIHWVLGHTDIPGNEAADRLAKVATKLDPKSY